MTQDEITKETKVVMTMKVLPKTLKLIDEISRKTGIRKYAIVEQGVELMKDWVKIPK